MTLSHVTAWTEYFGALLGTAPEPLPLAPTDVVKQQLFSVSPKGSQADMSDGSGVWPCPLAVPPVFGVSPGSCCA